MLRARLLWRYLAPAVCVVMATYARADTRLHVTLASSSKAYVLGQPVELTVTAANVGNEPVGAWVNGLDYQIQVHLAREGEKFERHDGAPDEISYGVHLVEQLLPGKSKVYKLRVLYTFRESEDLERRRRLAFDAPGTWLVKVRYPLSPHRRMYESNTIRIDIKAPEGADARVWQQINRAEFLYFLQFGYTRGNNPDVVRKGADLVQAAPESSYHPAIKWALQQHYHRRISNIGQLTAQQDPELEKIREAIGIPKVAEGPFPEDRRLDQLIAYHFPKLTPLEEVFQVISAQSGVGLSLAPTIKGASMSSVAITKTLRAFMKTAAGDNATWVPYGDGYRLVPLPKPK